MSKSYLNAALLFLLLTPLVNAVPIFPKETLFFDRLTANDEQIKLINNPEILFTSVGITTNQDVTRARIIVQAMPDCPENAPYQANVLQCFFVSSNFDENKITNAEIEFKVPKQWIDANNFDRNKLELRRYSYSWNNNLQGDLSSWKILQTSLENEDDKYYYYKTQSAGIDYFSIIGSKIIVTNNIQSVKQNAITSSAVKEVPITKNVSKSGSNSFYYVLLIAYSSLFVSFIPMLNRKTSSFEQLTNYIKRSDKNEEETKQILKDSGWEDWQVDLAIREAKK